MKMMMTRDVFALIMMSLVGLVVASNSIVLEVSAILPASVTNFQGHFTCPNVMLGKPKTEEQVSLIVKEHPLVKASGVGHSWNTEFTCSGNASNAVIRLTNKESGYLSYSSDEPVMGFNMEDYVQYNNGGKNDDFQAVMDVFRSPVCGPARVHWGKAGWDQSRGQEVCFDGAAEFPNTWCDFGCAVSELDPNGKFAGISTKWQWAASSKRSGDVVVEFAQCCGPDGFKKDMCTCESVLPAEC